MDLFDGLLCPIRRRPMTAFRARYARASRNVLVGLALLVGLSGCGGDATGAPGLGVFTSESFRPAGCQGNADPRQHRSGRGRARHVPVPQLRMRELQAILDSIHIET